MTTRSIEFRDKKVRVFSAERGQNLSSAAVARRTDVVFTTIISADADKPARRVYHLANIVSIC